MITSSPYRDDCRNTVFQLANLYLFVYNDVENSVEKDSVARGVPQTEIIGKLGSSREVLGLDTGYYFTTGNSKSHEPGWAAVYIGWASFWAASTKQTKQGKACKAGKHVNHTQLVADRDQRANIAANTKSIAEITNGDNARAEKFAETHAAAFAEKFSEELVEKVVTKVMERVGMEKLVEKSAKTFAEE